MPINVNATITIPDWEIHIRVSRASGPGGQHVNRTNSRVTLCWYPATSGALNDAQRARVCARLRNRISNDGELLLHVDTHRSQLRNREEAGERLAELIRGALVVKKRRRKTKPTRGSVERRLTQKRVRSTTKALRKKPTDKE